MKIIVFGGDGFCGWPTALHLSSLGHDIVIVDNLSRRDIDNELETNSLTPIATMSARIKAWNEITGKQIEFLNFNIAKEYDRLLHIFYHYKPDAVVHFAEQRAAPYSMKSERQKRYTVDNNLNATHNLLCAIVDSKQDAHVVHLGTMGVYGYGVAGMKIPEGYLKVQVVNEVGEISDLHQGIVWGTNTKETTMDERLINRFDYDGDYGTVLNRFLMQAAIGYPLTVHGTGGQTRAFIHIQDTVRCIELALMNPPTAGSRVKILNQMTETHRVRDLAKMVSEMIGIPVEFMKNPRFEADENDLYVDNKSFIEMGLNPITLNKGLLLEVHEIAAKYKVRCDRDKIPARSLWRR
jgi:UDP-sulfoquinovose synthase